LAAEFIKEIWNDQPEDAEWFCLAYPTGETWHHIWFKRGRFGKISDTIQRYSDRDLYWCIRGFPRRRRLKKEAVPSRYVHSDLDAVDPTSIKKCIAPTWAMQTSRGHWQAIWQCDGIVGQELHTRINRMVGADHCHDLNHVIRVPWTVNRKPKYEPFSPQVSLRRMRTPVIKVADLDRECAMPATATPKAEVTRSEKLMARVLELNRQGKSHSQIVADVMNRKNSWSAHIYTHADGTEVDDPQTHAERQVRRIIERFGKGRRRGVFVDLSNSDPIEEVDWLWTDFVAIGEVTTIFGHEGLKKSFIVAWMAAMVTRGTAPPWITGKARRGRVIMLTAEGGVRRARRRLKAAGADMDRVRILQAVRNDDDEMAFNIKRDADVIRDMIDDMNNDGSGLGPVLMVIIDPVSSYMDEVNGWRNNEVRSALEGMTREADRHRFAVVIVTHRPKHGKGAIDSVAFTTTACTAFLVDEEFEEGNATGRSRLLCWKTNEGELPMGRACRLEKREMTAVSGKTIQVPYVVWDDDRIDVTAKEAMHDEDNDRADDDGRVATWLRQRLTAGPMWQDDVRTAGDAEGHTFKQLRSALKRIRGHSSKQRGVQYGRWFWHLEADAVPPNRSR
jgi:putative DNA primase/helicase